MSKSAARLPSSVKRRIGPVDEELELPVDLLTASLEQHLAEGSRVV
jgi:hypothetical protein